MEMIFIFLAGIIFGYLLGTYIAMGVAVYKDVRGIEELDMDTYKRELITSFIGLLLLLAVRILYEFLCR
jgi:hypothetical protein